MMTLPILNNDIRYTVDLPISGERLSVRPYLVKEEKILLTAMESENKRDIVDAVFQVLSNCTNSYPVESLPLNDVEFLLLKLKMYSSGEVVEVNVKCNNPVDRPILNKDTGQPTGETKEVPCEHVTTIEVNLEEELEMDASGILENKVILTEDHSVGVTLRPPTFGVFPDVVGDKTGTEISFEFLADAIESVWQDDEVFNDFSSEEAQNFLESLDKKQMKKIEKYLESLPKQTVEREYKCPRCAYEQKLVLKDFFDFFTD